MTTTSSLIEPGRLRLALLPALLLFLLLAWQLNFLCDDSYISFRYSHNAAEGNGLRYNLAKAVPVEGYSNFLWVVWLAFLDWLGLEITTWARISSVLCGLFLVAAVTKHAARRLQLDFVGAALTGLFFASLPATAVWATGGLATMATALFLFCAYERLLGDKDCPRGFQAGIFAALAALVRADGAVWIAMLLAAATLHWLFISRDKRLIKAIFTAGTIVALAVVVHVTWRYSYYGDYLPNTARVKAGYSAHRLQRGTDYLAANLLSIPTIAVVALLALRGLKKPAGSIWLPAFTILLGTFTYAAYVGGDFMPMGRFLYPAFAFLPMLFALSWKSWTGKAQPLVASAVASLVIAVQVCACFDWNLVPNSVRSHFHFRQDRTWESEISMQRNMKQRAENWTVQGKALALFVNPGESMSLGAIGAMGYYSGLEIYDTYGLVTPEVIAAGEPKRKSSPGHDRRVGPMFFNDHRPTYAGSMIAKIGEPLSEQLGNWEAHPLSKLVEIEHHKLDPAEGFEPGTELRLLRFTRWE
ncbi:MAG: arabinofuranosyltransferase [Planctomycetota bacterium]